MKKIEKDLGNGNEIINYDNIDLSELIKLADVNISFQKSLIKGSLEKILSGMGIENLSQEIIKKSFGGAGFFTINTKKYGMLNFLGSKGGDSSEEFIPVTDYYIGGTDIGDQIQARGLKLQKLTEILGKKEWGVLTELLFFFMKKYLRI